MSYQPLTDADFTSAFPGSRKVYVEGPHGVRVPMREITLAAGEPALRVYDTSGPRGTEAEVGLPALRAPWIRERGDVVPIRTTGRAEVLRAKAGAAVTQLHYARRGDVTPEMEFIAL